MSLIEAPPGGPCGTCGSPRHSASSHDALEAAYAEDCDEAMLRPIVLHDEISHGAVLMRRGNVLLLEIQVDDPVQVSLITGAFRLQKLHVSVGPKA